MSMSKSLRISFIIKGMYPDSLSMSRLADYLKELSNLYGSHDSVHFDKVTKGSAALNTYVDSDEVRSDVVQRALSAKSSGASDSIRDAVDNINAMLAKDRAYATLKVGRTKILDFPGRKAPDTPEQSMEITEEGSIQGVLIRLSGAQSTITAWLTSESGERITNITLATEELAKSLAQHFRSLVRLIGEGTWVRVDGAHWDLKSFRANEFHPLDDESLADVMKRLRSMPENGWQDVDDPIEEIQKLREY